ncbi:hypothetical protein M514_01743 [Trichuris suis]|uniref:Nucleotide-diphospho-sugar transferase domain-containing protein n=1 Tax=Trichuris suis TaxID=68888 RepID=A0A085MJ36_9BILA|nr:hypothetical protein M513_01743 [Trichuris suis]KFD72622.1 hypothetical protein M514_01743 [Trichuris suis]
MERLLNVRFASVQKVTHVWLQTAQISFSFQSILVAVAIGLVVSLLYPILLVQYTDEISTKDASQTVRSCTPTRGRIGILLYMDSPKRYNVTLSSWHCYAQLHGYKIFVVQAYFESLDSQKACAGVISLFFRRHCIASIYLEQVDWLLFVDADSAVINMSRCLEEFVDPNYHIVHFERFFSGEVAAGSYFVRNSPEGKSYLAKWYQNEGIMRQVNFHNMDNGVLQLNVLSELGVRSSKIAECHQMFLAANSLRTYFVYLGCTKRLLQNISKKQRQQSSIKILEPLHGWMRDGWLTSYYWSSTDFILHGFKQQSDALLRFLTDRVCSKDSVPAQNYWIFLWPTKHYFQTSLPVFLKLIASAERRSARYHPDVFTRRAKIADCFPHCQPLEGEQLQSQRENIRLSIFK